MYTKDKHGQDGKPAAGRTHKSKSMAAGAGVAEVFAAIGLAGFDFEGMNQEFIHRAGPDAVNDATSYGVQIKPVDVAPGQSYWKVIGIHHLLPIENRDRHNAFIDVLDENGQRVHGPAQIGWIWEGKPDGPAQPRALDKPAGEPATDIPIEKNMTVTLWVEGAGASEAVTGLHTRHEDEFGPDGARNSRFHHSYYVVFQRTVAGATQMPGAGKRTNDNQGKPGVPTHTFRFQHWPTESRQVIQPFGVNPENYERFGLPGHEGIDIVAADGSPIFAVAPGTVKMVYTQADYANKWHPYGVHIRLRHMDGYETIYAHFREPKVSVGDRVTSGQIIGLADHTGNVFGAPGDHLHLTLKHRGEAAPGYPNNIIDPMPFLQALLDGQTPDTHAEQDKPDMVGVEGASMVGTVRLAEKLGLNCNAPIDNNGAISPRLANPNLIKDTGATWVRLNFILRPFNTPEDPQWIATYRQIIRNLRDAGLQTYGLIHAEAVANDPGNQFRDEPPAGTVDHPWIRQYASNFRRIVELFRDDVAVFESFNEPNNWHRTPTDPTQWSKAWIHPAWFAIMLQRVFEAVKDLDITLVAGPLLSTPDGNDAAVYLPQVYAAGRNRFGWGQANPFPFHGVGFHPYLLHDSMNPDAEIPARYETYMDAVRAVIRNNEGRSKPIYLSEIGFQNAEDRQALCMQAGLKVALNDPSVALCIWYGMQDDGVERYGLFRAGGLSANDRKPIYDRFKQLAASSQSVPVARVFNRVPDATFCGEFDSVPDDSLLSPRQRFSKVWCLSNTGTTTWDSGYHLVAISTLTLGAQHMLPIPSCRPGESIQIEVPFVAPVEPGDYISTWSLADGSDTPFGDQVWTRFRVVAEEVVPVVAGTPPPIAEMFEAPLDAFTPMPAPGAFAPSGGVTALEAMAAAIVYQTYWMRMTAAAAQPDAQSLMQAAAEDALRQLRTIAVGD